MIKTRGRRPLTCHHEAGHAVARWWLGHLADQAVVLTMDEVRAGVTIPGRRGREQQSEGSVVGYDLVEPHMRGQERAFRTEANFVEQLAGSYAEACYRRRSVSLCLFEGGAGDLAELARLRIETFGDDPEGQRAVMRADSISRTLVRSPMGAAAVRVVADTLLARGRINFLQIDALCSAAYGAPFAYDRWSGAWPPTPAQVRDGYLPPAEREAGGVIFIAENGEGPGVRLRKERT